MGNMCATTRNKECFYSTKAPHEVKDAFNNCIAYRKCDITKSKLKKKKKKYMRRIKHIDHRLTYDY